MIIDCFPFFNEIDLLKKIRLELLDDIVDRVVLVESTRTFSLKKRNYTTMRTKIYSKDITKK